MDEKDEKILKLMQSDARISYSELGKALDMSRVAAKKRVKKLERDGVIRGYNTCIYREDEVTLFIDIIAAPGRLEKVLDYLTTKTAFIRQIFKTTREDQIHIVAVSDVQNLKYLTAMIRKQCGDDIVEFHSHAAKEVIKDVYGGIGYEKRSVSDGEGHNGEA